MKNMDQIRAKNAIGQHIGSGVEGGDAVAKKVTAMVRENGLLGALAFAKEKGTGYADVFNAAISHLVDLEVLENKEWSLELLIRHLCGLDSAQLRAVTSEIVAYLSYLRRFA